MEFAMLKKIRLDIESTITDLDERGMPDGEPQISRTSHPGVMRVAADEISLSYRESDENGCVSCVITIRGGLVSVRREGAIVSVMLFDPDEPFKTIYSIPPYKFDMEIVTESLSVDVCEAGGKINVLYGMNVGGAVKKAKMTILAEVTG